MNSTLILTKFNRQIELIQNIFLKYFEESAKLMQSLIENVFNKLIQYKT